MRYEVKQVFIGDLSSVILPNINGIENGSSKSLRNISTCLLNYTASHPEDGNQLQTWIWALELPKRLGISLPAERRSASQEGLN
jgi:hypothetical protein